MAAPASHSFGSLDGRPTYHTAAQLWPVGYCAEWPDPAAGVFTSSIIDAGDDGPQFMVTLVPADAGVPHKVSHTSHLVVGARHV